MTSDFETATRPIQICRDETAYAAHLRKQPSTLGLSAVSATEMFADSYKRCPNSKSHEMLGHRIPNGPKQTNAGA